VELGYGARFGAGVDGQRLLAGADWAEVLDGFDRVGVALARYVLADHRMLWERAKAARGWQD
jgi:DNA repair protein RecO (recombination protein O)